MRLTLASLSPTSQKEALEAFQLTAFPKLETLIVGESQVKDLLKDVTLPNIRSLQATVGGGDYNHHFDISDVSSKLPGLRTCDLKLTGVTTAQLVELLNNPHLQEVTLNLPTWDYQGDAPVGKSNSQVTKFHIHGAVSSSSNRFSEIYLPKLQVFAWSDAFDIKPYAIRVQLQNLLKKSSPALHTLIFDHIPIKDKTLKETLTSLSTLHVLKLHATRITDELIDLLASDTGLCPGLDVLDVNVKKSPHGYPRITRSALESLKSSRDQTLTIIYNEGRI